MSLFQVTFILFQINLLNFSTNLTGGKVNLNLNGIKHTRESFKIKINLILFKNFENLI